MASISVKLRVVGIQFHSIVTVDKVQPKIVDVLEAARTNGSGFNYVVAPDGTLHQASAIRPAAPSISSGRPYEAGLYVLSDGVAGENSVTTWQWYLIRNGIQMNQPNSHVEPFSTTSPTIENGDEVIWRLVVVATRPRIPASISAFANKTSRLPKQ
jgi:hypothetical protein